MIASRIENHGLQRTSSVISRTVRLNNMRKLIHGLQITPFGLISSQAPEVHSSVITWVAFDNWPDTLVSFEELLGTILLIRVPQRRRKDCVCDRMTRLLPAVLQRLIEKLPYFWLFRGR